jgi:alkylated DNA repair dioxygenase AlkB
MDSIKGLKIINDYIDDSSEQELISIINSEPWSTSISRRTQHYYKSYNYQSKDLIENAPEPPEAILKLKNKLISDGLISDVHQIIINEYEPGQGIAKHIDRPDMFGPVIISLSLGSPCTMNFAKESVTTSLTIQRRTLVVMTGESRYLWTHEIPKTKRDRTGIRISITFRTINDKASSN